ncbi:Bromodomain-containing protein [Artemisia annua]|uniref:Bromodomain-containing protein n=1 Tax=Artemisia annua TaxID=35608 RepID=A0A2U1PZD0_ARTAN|nr:Bromodomain-containing protein [Artemisia annua]
MDAAASLQDVQIIDSEEQHQQQPSLRVDHLGQNVDQIFLQVDQLEKRLNEVEQFYSKSGKKQSNTSKASSVIRDRDKDKPIIEKPMDFSTIEKKWKAKDGTGYTNVREMCADVRLIFKNAMKYNDERHDVHVMAKTLLDKFEEKWLQLLPKVDEEVNSDI